MGIELPIKVNTILEKFFALVTLDNFIFFIQKILNHEILINIYCNYSNSRIYFFN